MRILEVATEAPPYRGGISRIVGLLSEELTQLGHEVDIVTPKLRLREFKISTRQLRQFKGYDIIHLHGPTPFWSDFILLRNSNTPLVYTHHADISWGTEALSKYYRTFHRKLVNKAKAIVVHSKDYAGLFGDGNVSVVNLPCNFVPSKKENYLLYKSTVFTVLFVGQLRPFKGLDLLLNVASALEEVSFSIVGQGYLKEKLERKAANLRNVKFLGPLNDDDLEKIYKKSHVICLPSINTTEAFGLTLVEGSIFGCVPIASNLAGVRENVEHLGGYVFEPGSPSACAKKIRLLFEDSSLWSNTSQAVCSSAFDYSRRNTIKYYAKKHQEIFEKCLRK